MCESMQSRTYSCKRYFVTFTDEYSHFTTVFLLRNKSEIADKFTISVVLAETQTGKVVKTIRCDNGGEYTSDEMTKFCQRRGIEQKFTPPYTPQLSRVAERMNWTPVECARCMINHAGLPKMYNGEAIMTAAFLRNRCSTHGIVVDKTIYYV